MLINPYKLPKASEERLGGIKAAEKTTETAEVKIDTATGKLYAPEIISIPTTTTEPPEAWTGGGHKIVILSSEPVTKYAGWIYLIEEVV